jgi:hypothetical protein
MAYHRNNIISRRIPSGLGRVSAHTVRGGLDGAESCGPDQQWDPNFVFMGVKGQCTAKGSPMTPTPDAGWFADFMTTAFPKPAAPAVTAGMTPAQVQQMIAAQKAGAGGMSTNTMLAIGAGAVGLIIVIALASRK